MIMSKKTEKTENSAGMKIEGSLAEVIPNRRTEWRFALPLPALVEGKVPGGNVFQEETVLKDISSTGAYFGLDQGITVGTHLQIIIDLPERLTEGKKVRLRLEGTAVRLQKLTGEGQKKQGIALKFDEEFLFERDGASE